ncbi:ankyrin repeat domain-containing protein [Chelatococcus reniformis]|uniref:Ankyrin repeat domain-containing protein n=1 Tax=Chelatococcus reniformis TaxID=1494448 RepID=A0A916X954_9HYPH|nr:hypothetical protein [Chelatococcus reniformis]GGC56343.1 hypothetical protein GCM10010994_14080 [Chelatococcus reniformis]
MKRLTDRPNLDHLRKQAKDLLARYRSGDAAALARIRDGLPAAVGKDDAAVRKLGLRLHDAQSCVAREYGFPSWTDLKIYVEARVARASGRVPSPLDWLRLVYAGDLAGGTSRARPRVAAMVLDEAPGFVGDDPYLACAAGDIAVLRRATEDDPQWVNRSGGALDLPPLVAVTHSSLARLPAFRERLHACARLLLDAGAHPNQSAGSRSPPASLSQPAEEVRLSALYGAAGQNHDGELTDLLLTAGANPNDGESLYHALESLDCTRRLLAAGARIAGSNAVYRILDLDSIDGLRLLLSYGANPNEPAPGAPTAHSGSPLLWAIRRRRSPAHIAALLAAGADPAARTRDGTSAHTLALRLGLPDVAELLPSDAGGPISDTEQFITACARGDRARARRLLARRGGLMAEFTASQLRVLPELAALGCGEPVRLMVELGWPIATTGGDWNASALNHAVFRGDAALTRFLLEHGASWRERHGFGDNACGTLSWASCNEPVDGGDWLGCAEALVAHGMPMAQPDPAGGADVVIEGYRKRFSDEVTDFLLRGPASGRV